MNWGNWGANHSSDKMSELILSAFNNGINSFDHADIYGGYTTEETFGDRKLSIKNTILFDVLEEQTNIVGVKIKNTKRTLTFNKNKKENWVLIN